MTPKKLLLLLLISCLSTVICEAFSRPLHQILLDTDVDTDDFFALLYILKLNRSEFNLKAITINANAWTDAGHAVNQIYDILYMMDRDDIPVGVGGDGGILPNGTVLPNVGGYVPLIEQDISTVAGCRYRQAIPTGLGGRLDVNTNYGIRRSFLPQVKIPSIFEDMEDSSDGAVACMLIRLEFQPAYQVGISKKLVA